MSRIKRYLAFALLVFVAAFNFTACGRIIEGPGTKDVMSEETENYEKENKEKGGDIPEVSVSEPSGEEQNDNNLHPYIRGDGFRVMYGFADSKGNVVIEPAFKYAEPFYQCGLAPVTAADERKGLIDKTGKYVVHPEWDLIKYSEGTFICYKFEGNYFHVYDGTGTLLFEHYDYTEGFSEGLMASYNEYKRGYLDKNGDLVLPLYYTRLGKFVNGIAEVAPSWMDPTYYIDKYGNDLTDIVSSGLSIFIDARNMYGFKNNAGEIVIPADYSFATPFLNGYSIVKPADAYDERYGVIDTNGSYVLEPVYCGIQRLSNGLVAVGEKADDYDYIPYGYFDYCLKALFTPDFKKTTNWIYYTVSDLDNENVCVSDGESIIFIDKDLNRSDSLPEIKGFGSFAWDNDLMRGYLNGKLTVIDKKGNVVSRASGDIDLGSGLIAEKQIRMPSPATTIAYPALTGMKDKELQERINDLIISLIADPREKYAYFNGPEDTSVQDVGYSLSKKKDLLMIDQKGYMYYLGAAHDFSFRYTVYIDLATGAEYKLSDLFRQDSGVWDYLSTYVTEKIRESMDEMIYFEDSVTIDPATKFALTDDGIDFYFNQGDIAANAAGMQVFHVPYTDLADYLDTNGAFWKSFN
jgi:hypothetical protein